MCVCARVALQGCLVWLGLSLTARPHLDGRITGIVSSMEQLEARRVNLKETFEKQRVDVMSISRELQHTESSLKQKVGRVQGLALVGGVQRPALVGGVQGPALVGGVQGLALVGGVQGLALVGGVQGLALVERWIYSCGPFPSQERLLTQVQAEVQSLQSTLASLQGELGAELHSQLEPSDQREVGGVMVDEAGDSECVGCEGP